MIEVTLGQLDARPKFAQTFLETVGRGNSAERTDVGIAQTLERQSLPRDDVLQMQRPMRAFDNLGGAIVATDALEQLVVRLARALGDKNITGPAQIARWLAQRAARQKEFVSERRLPIDQDDVEAMFQMQILQTVIEQERVCFHFADRVQPALHAILVHENDHILQIVREHVRLVAGRERIEQKRFAIGNNARRRGIPFVAADPANFSFSVAARSCIRD